MKIYDAKYILIGLLAFVVLATFPVWFDHGKAVRPPDPSLNTPVINGLVAKHCILPKDQMITEHMKLLNQWRTEVVRYGQRVYMAPGGNKYEMSLETKCFRCHSNKAQFCDRCHNYAGLDKMRATPTASVVTLFQARKSLVHSRYGPEGEQVME